MIQTVPRGGYVLRQPANGAEPTADRPAVAAQEPA
jgi:hypothetical protein